MNKTISPKITVLTFGTLVICFAIAFYVIAWQEPSQTPPGGNVAAPLNVGPTGQSKSGGLILNTGGALIGLIVDKGQTILKYLSTPFVFNTASRPSPPETGQFYFDQNDKNLYYYNGTMWMRIESVPSGTGKSCTSPAQCESGYCIDGYCCNSACNTTCYSCAVPGREGYCTALTAMAEDSGCSQACVGCRDGRCVNWENTTRDDVGSNTCLSTHYRCNGSGSCTAPKSYTCLSCLSLCGCSAEENICYRDYQGSTVCADRGYDGCVGTARDSWCGEAIYCGYRCCEDVGNYEVIRSIKCFNWVYD